MAIVTPSDYAYIRDHLRECSGDDRRDRELHLKKELNALLELARIAYILIDTDELHRSITLDNQEWNDWANNYIRELQEALDRHIQPHGVE